MKAKDDSAATNVGNASTSHTDSRNSGNTKTDVSAKDHGVAANGGSASSTVTTNKSEAKDGSAASNTGTATATNNKSDAKGDGSAATNVGSATSTYLDFKGDGNAISTGAGTATATYRVNNQYLEGSVTGSPSGLPTDGTLLASIPFGNTIDHSLVGNAGITQTFQNSGTGLAQQSVMVDGTVNVTQGSASIAP